MLLIVAPHVQLVALYMPIVANIGEKTGKLLNILVITVQLVGKGNDILHNNLNIMEILEYAQEGATTNTDCRKGPSNKKSPFRRQSNIFQNSSR